MVLHICMQYQIEENNNLQEDKKRIIVHFPNFTEKQTKKKVHVLCHSHKSP